MNMALWVDLFREPGPPGGLPGVKYEGLHWQWRIRDRDVLFQVRALWHPPHARA